MNILIVDEDPIVVELLSVFLANRGHLVKSLCGKKRAMEVLEFERYDWAFVDFKAQDSEGAKFIELIRHHHPAVKIVMMTAAIAQAQALAVRASIDKIVEKPLKWEDIAELVAKFEAV